MRCCDDDGDNDSGDGGGDGIDCQDAGDVTLAVVVMVAIVVVMMRMKCSVRLSVNISGSRKGEVNEKEKMVCMVAAPRLLCAQLSAGFDPSPWKHLSMGRFRGKA